MKVDGWRKLQKSLCGFILHIHTGNSRFIRTCFFRNWTLSKVFSKPHFNIYLQYFSACFFIRNSVVYIQTFYVLFLFVRCIKRDPPEAQNTNQAVCCGHQDETKRHLVHRKFWDNLSFFFKTHLPVPETTNQIRDQAFLHLFFLHMNTDGQSGVHWPIRVLTLLMNLSGLLHRFSDVLILCLLPNTLGSIQVIVNSSDGQMCKSSTTTAE